MGHRKMGHLSGLPLLTVFLFLTFPRFSPLLFCQERLPEIPITMDARNRTVRQVLDEITLQTGYYFTYNASLISGENRVRFHVKGLPLEETLDSLLRQSRFAYRIIDRNIVIFKKNDSGPSPFHAAINRPILKGRVVDSRSGKPLPYATIALYGSSLGSISNQEGEFSFKLPPELQDPLLVFSYMGYGRRFLPVNYPLEGELIVELEKETIPLQEVVIRYTDPVILWRKALQGIAGNYLNDHSTMTAFYRESVKRNDHYMLYSEAVLDVAKGPYTPLSAGDQVSIRKGMKITDVSTEDTVMVKLRSGIYTSLTLDVVKNRPDFLTHEFQELYDLEFTDIMTYGERLAYVISFRQKSHITDLMFRGKLYLDQETLAILAADFEFNPDLIQKEPGLFLVSSSPKIRIRPVFARYHVDYRELDGTYHISQVRAEVEMKVRKKRQWIGPRYRITIEMAITDVVPGERLKINLADRVRPDIVMADQPFVFDPAFWGVHNTIEPEASLKEALQRIGQSQLE
ncbi:MAG TPA: hypothetical protein ENO05_02425, partial [Bacteroides sp.]|nr:hypothetical protein [Bacteroides sp.]